VVPAGRAEGRSGLSLPNIETPNHIIFGRSPAAVRFLSKRGMGGSDVFRDHDNDAPCLLAGGRVTIPEHADFV
jgi:hypothetical protein